MRPEGLNLNSALVPQTLQVTDRAMFTISICASASHRHVRQFTMSSPSALPMNANDSESKRGIIIRILELIVFCIVSHKRRRYVLITRAAGPQGGRHARLDGRGWSSRPCRLLSGSDRRLQRSEDRLYQSRI